MSHLKGKAIMVKYLAQGHNCHDWDPHSEDIIIIISQLRRPIELKLSQVCYFMHMLRCTK